MKMSKALRPEGLSGLPDFLTFVGAAVLSGTVEVIRRRYQTT